jgi:hypothetical protein
MNTRNGVLTRETPEPPKYSSLPMAVRKLVCGSGKANRMEKTSSPNARWNLEFCSTTAKEADVSDDDDSLSSDDDSQITVETVESTNLLQIGTPNTPGSPTLPVRTIDCALLETPTDDRKTKRKRPDDCHIIIRWSQLVQLIETNFTCSCGHSIKNLDRRTVGIATDVDFHCQSCKKTASALADRSDYVEEKLETSFIRREARIDSYEMNWRLLMSTQLMGESQVGGSIIGMFLDLSRETFRNQWVPM